MMAHTYDLLDVEQGLHNAAYTTFGIIVLPGDSGERESTSERGGVFGQLACNLMGVPPSTVPLPTLFISLGTVLEGVKEMGVGKTIRGPHV